MSYVNDWKNSEDGTTQAQKKRDVVYIEKQVRPKWHNAAGDMMDPSTWRDENGYYDFEVTGRGAWSLGFGLGSVFPGDIIRGAHAHIALPVFQTQNEYNPENRRGRILRETSKPLGGVLDIKVERAFPVALPTSDAKRIPRLVKLAQLGNAHAARELTERGVAVPPPLPAAA